MKVSQNVNNSVRSSEATQTSQAKKSESAQKSNASHSQASPKVEIAGSYNTEISGHAKEMALAKSTAENTGDVREAKIAELKRRIANKEYNVKPDAVAEKMIKDHLQTPGL